MAVAPKAYQQARDLILESAHTLLLTGAGVSTRSGIPDFRSPGTGIWQFADPLEIASVWGVREDPQRFYRWLRPLAEKMRNALPNPAHTGFARLQQMGLLHTVVTQNIDDLHEQAGTHSVLHVHGSAQDGLCMGCGLHLEAQHFWPLLYLTETVPVCPHCGDIVKPDVVLFGEELPAHLLAQAQQAALTCDLVIVAGASLEVMPTADLPLLAKRAGARILTLNLTATLLDDQSDLLIHEDVTRSVPRLVEMCLQRR
ncbi:MAG: NAD-dependent protein deacylase [Caldilineaceae bacterium]|nr:NAD-dependent protein deacylase [Caldilineaceae bacterium]